MDEISAEESEQKKDQTAKNHILGGRPTFQDERSKSKHEQMNECQKSSMETSTNLGPGSQGQGVSDRQSRTLQAFMDLLRVKCRDTGSPCYVLTVSYWLMC